MRLSRSLRYAAPALALTALAACGSNGEQKSGAEVADQMEAAADQSDPQAAKVIDQRADEVRGMESVAPAEANSAVQDTMREAGAAAASTGSANQ